MAERILGIDFWAPSKLKKIRALYSGKRFSVIIKHVFNTNFVREETIAYLIGTNPYTVYRWRWLSKKPEMFKCILNDQFFNLETHHTSVYYLTIMIGRREILFSFQCVLAFIFLAIRLHMDQITKKTSNSSLGRYVFGSEISYNKAPPRLPGLGC